MTYLKTIRDVIGFLMLSIVLIIESLIKSLIPKKYKMKSINGEIALVTGGGGGLGRLLCLRLSNLGAIVVIWDINKAGIDETVKLVQTAGGTCYGYVCDLCDREDIYNKAKIINEEIGKVSILINNAGMATGMKFLNTPDNLIIRTMDVNVMSHFWTTKAFLPAMIEANKGHIVSVASLAGHIGVPELVDYCTSKFAAVGFNESLRVELENEGYNIDTTVVCPFFIRSTGMFNKVESSYIPRLSSNDVADRIITALRCNEKFAIIPGYLQVLIGLRWLVPYKCTSIFLGAVIKNIPQEEKYTQSSASTAPGSRKEEMCNVPTSKDQNGAIIQQQLNKRISSSERKP